MQVDVDLVRQLAELLDTTQLTEIEVEDGDRKIRVARKIQHAAAAPVYQAPPPAFAAPLTATLMLLAIEQGNTNTLFAIHDGSGWTAQWRTATDSSRTADEATTD